MKFGNGPESFFEGACFVTRNAAAHSGYSPSCNALPDELEHIVGILTLHPLCCNTAYAQFVMCHICKSERGGANKVIRNS